MDRNKIALSPNGDEIPLRDTGDLCHQVNPRQDSFTSNLRRKTHNIAAAITSVFLLLLIVGTGLGIIDGETLNALKPMVEELVENQSLLYNRTNSVV